MEGRRRSRAKPAKEQRGSLKAVWVSQFRAGQQVGEQLEQEERDIHIFETEPAYVRVAAGQTVNLGDYESLRVDVAITMPCYVENVNETHQECAEWVAERLGDEVSTYVGEEEDDSKNKKKKR